MRGAGQRQGWATIAGIVGALAIAAPANAGDVRAVRLWESPDHTRAVFDLTAPVDYKVFVLDGPARVVVDVRSGQLGKGFVVPPGKGLVRNVRSGRPQRDQLRLVIDLAAAARPKTFLVAPAEGKGHRLVVDLFPKDAPATPVKTVQAIAGNGARDVIVAIDAGHGGEDPGAIGASGTYEKQITLQVARELARQIDAEPGMSAVLVRDGDYFIQLKQRYQKAREAKADLFISIHADAFRNHKAAGSSVFMLSQRGASSEAARWLAVRENASDLVGGVSLDDKDGTLAAVLLDLSQGATLSASDAVANQVLRAISQLGRTHKRDVQRANFVVLRSPDVPSILIETAFISNPADEKRLRDAKHQARLASAIVDGVREYFHAAPPPGTWIAAHPLPARQHIVARGESLSLIAQRHGVTVAQLRNHNGLKSDMVRVGAVLRIPTSS